MKPISTSSFLLAACLLAAGTTTSQAVVAYGLTTNGLTRFDTGNPAVVLGSSAFSGLTAGDTIVDIDYRPSDGQLYAMASSGRLYTVNPSTGSAVVNTSAGVGALGTVTVADFNPAADRLRVFSGLANYRITPGTGAITPDGNLSYVAGDPNASVTPNLVSAAYTNSFSGSTTTVLYSLDAGTNSLVTHTGGPAFSSLNTVGQLTIGGLLTLDIGQDTGFDIYSFGGGNTAYFSAGNALYELDLSNGEATPLGDVGGSAITRLAVVPEPGAALLSLLPLTALVMRRRRSC